MWNKPVCSSKHEHWYSTDAKTCLFSTTFVLTCEKVLIKIKVIPLHFTSVLTTVYRLIKKVRGEKPWFNICLCKLTMKMTNKLFENQKNLICVQYLHFLKTSEIQVSLMYQFCLSQTKTVCLIHKTFETLNKNSYMKLPIFFVTNSCLVDGHSVVWKKAYFVRAFNHR